ncbi:MAG TPA: hypothetical protein VH518_19025 [Tepidisphaeraceae bacterium]|jgi:hypothetical protein
MPRDFYPREQAKILQFTENFRDLILAAPGDYGLSVAQAEAYRVTQENFALAYDRARDPSTRTRPAVAGKEDARVALEAATRLLARIIRAMPNVTDQMRINLGLSQPVIAKAALLPIPDSRPVVLVVGNVGGGVQVRLRDSVSPRRGKPDGVAGASLFAYAGEAAPADMSLWQYKGSTTRPSANLDFRGATPGTHFWLAACWYNTRGQPGPVSMPVSIYLQSGMSFDKSAMLRAA